MKKGLFILLILMSVFVLCSCNKSNNEKSKILYDGLYAARQDCEFIIKAAGNVNRNGSRKFDDEFVAGFRNSLKDVDIEYFNSNYSEMTETLQNIQINISGISVMLEDMGRTNSGAEVPLIKKMSKNTIVLIDELFKNELKDFN